MASTLKINTLTGVTTAGSIAVTAEGNSTTTNLQQGLAKSWINFNGESTIAVRDSFNNSSIGDNGTGNYTVTRTSVMGNTNYTHGGMAGASTDNLINISQPSNSSTPTTTASLYSTLHANTSHSDGHFVGVQIFGDLA